MEKRDPVNGLSAEAVWRGELTVQQRKQLESWMAAHPQDRGVWEEEVALTRLLTRLPDAAAPTNLTARVLDAIEQDAPEQGRTPGTSWFGWLRRMGWVPRLTGVVVLVVAGYLGHHRYRIDSQRAEIARSVAKVSELATAAPPVDVLQDFTAIRNLDHTGMADEQLLALLQ